MEKKDIVIVAGAGSSANLGFPLGDQVPREIQNQAAGIVKFIAEHRQRFADPAREDQLKQTQVELMLMLQKLPAANVSTIDEFIGVTQRREYAQMAAIATSYIITRVEAKLLQQPLLANTNNNRVWQSDLAVRMLKESEASARTQTTVLTLNYDRSLEWAIRSTFWARGERNLEDIGTLCPFHRINHLHGETKIDHDRAAATYMRLLHKHLTSSGKVGLQIKQIEADHWNVLTTAATIRLVDPATGIQSASVKDGNAKHAREILQQADVVLFMGFGFHKSCLDVLGINQSNRWFKPSVTIATTAIGEEPAIRSFIQKVRGELAIDPNSGLNFVTDLPYGQGEPFDCQDAIDWLNRTYPVN